MNKDNDKEKRAGFTPGPYELASTHPANDPEFFHILAKGRSRDIALIRYAKHDPGKSIDLANAHLLASAPELYEQCKLFERALVELQMQGETGADYELEKLREVLAKADGRAEA
jgi:hypothetical protein